jgi:hypothetical protein
VTVYLDDYLRRALGKGFTQFTLTATDRSTSVAFVVQPAAPVAGFDAPFETRGSRIVPDTRFTSDAPVNLPTDPVEPMLQFFALAQLPPRLQLVAKPFADLAQRIVDELPRNPERTVALRKLLEAKDCAVRSLVFQG